MITMTVGQLLEAKDALVRMMKLQLPLKQAYQLTKIAKVADVELELFEKARNARLEQYGEQTHTDENTGRKDYKILPENASKFRHEMRDLLAAEIELQVRPFDLMTLPEAVTVSAADLTSLGSLVTYTEPEGQTTEGAAIP